MKITTLGNLAKIAGGKLIAGNPWTYVTHINYGKYKLLHPQHVYVYSKSSKWINQLKAIRKTKPKALILPLHIPKPNFSIPIIRVANTTDAIWRIALWNWNQLRHRINVVGITGSAGKSTTTAMVSSIVRSHYRIVQTLGNLNTSLYLPRYLCLLEPRHNLLLLEMGMNSLHNIKRQCNIVRPHIGVVTNVGEAHAGSLGGLSYVVKAKQEMVDGVRPGGVLYLNADDPRSQLLKTSRCRGWIRRFGIHQKAEIRATNIAYTKRGMFFQAVTEGRKFPVFIPTYGIHNVYNALAAIGVARALRIPFHSIQRGLARFKAPKMRLQIIRTRQGRTLINDAWNANPTAMKAGLNVLKSIGYRKNTVAVLGDMLELGRLTAAAHRSIGRYIARLGIGQLITLGPRAKIIANTAIKYGMPRSRVFSYFSHNQVVHHLLRFTNRKSIIYFKASRKIRLEKVVYRMRNWG